PEHGILLLAQHAAECSVRHRKARALTGAFGSSRQPRSYDKGISCAICTTVVMYFYPTESPKRRARIMAVAAAAHRSAGPRKGARQLVVERPLSWPLTARLGTKSAT